nr:hypothetical protein [Lachnospiraceae bacterium]
MYRKSFMKVVAVLLAAACTVTAVPQAAFADELISSEPVLLEEELETVDGEALFTEDGAEADPVDEAAAFDGDDILNDDSAEAVTEVDDLEADREADAEFKNAKAIKINEKQNGTATEDSFKYYKFTPAFTGRYYVSGTGNEDMRFRMTDSEKYVTTTDKAYYYHDNRLWHKDNEPFDLIQGKTYYIVVEPEEYKEEVSFEFTIKE